ncbi:spermatogenesis-associated protein 1 [Corythoichthys intestinalis]|uniref:spermatogenesis-associated protein 1 n=1 Tax=Corythoichthys intestinalis TaxID=161448 RepID=UPI0025A5B79B|nr:spermatogenesis-associated protein 1 [Corythoichthys intestinalis]XP_061791013.1 spermatogenesis-associated protein 1-like [Nerophis lumbriciformis]
MTGLMKMELSSYAVDKRPISCKFVELHVLYVPDDQWNVKLNKVPAEATESFVSAGFIRVYPEVTLKAMRSDLRELLGTERSMDKFSFLKCVGRSLALVKSKQEKDVKAKTFAPPYAAQPELYLLLTVENESSLSSHSLSPDTDSSSPDPSSYYPHKTLGSPAETKELVKFPHIPQSSHQLFPTSSLEEEDEDDDEEQGYRSSEGGHGEVEGLSVSKSDWHERSDRGQRKSNSQAQNKGCLVQVKEHHKEEEATYRKKKNYHQGSRVAKDPGAVGLVDDPDLDRHLGKLRDVHTFQSIGNKTTSGVIESPVVLSRPIRCTSPPPGLDLTMTTHKPVVSTVVPTNREELIEEIKLVKEERKQLEWKRQELLRKGKDLLAQNRHRRNQARDSWKKKYFDTKKATAPLEDALRNVRQELETFYNKLLLQLHARDCRGNQQKQGTTSEKNALIIQILTESHDIDNLKRKVEDAKMKLVTEIKLRKQAATELRALKAELAQKKSQSCHHGPVASLSFVSRHETKHKSKTSSNESQE